MADWSNNIRVIKIFSNATEGDSSVITLGDFRAVGNMSLQYEVTGGKMNISYTASLNGDDYLKPINSVLKKKATGKGMLTFDPILSPFIKINALGKGNITIWIGIQ